MRKIIYLLLFTLLSANWAFGQNPIYTQDFGTGTSFAGLTGTATWSSSGSGVSLVNASPFSTGYTGASGGSHIKFDNSVIGDQVVTISNLNTLGFTSINVSLGQSSNSDWSIFTVFTLDWSSDGITWFPIGGGGFDDFTQGNDSWNFSTVSTLAPGANGVPNLRIRITMQGDGGGGIFRIDDFKVLGLPGGAVTYYSKAIGNLELTSSWTTDQTGIGGVSPTSFTVNDQTFSIRNNASPTIGAAWTVSGTNTKVVVESGSNFSIPAGFAFVGNIDVSSGATLTINNTSIPTFGTIDANSTIVFGATSQQTIPARTYGNLTLSGAASGHILSGSTIIGGILTVNRALGLNNQSLVLNGTIAGTTGGLISTAISNLTINGSGDFGSVRFGGARTINNLTINRSGTGTVTLGLSSSLTVNGQLSLTDGIFILGNNTLTLTNGSVSATSGRIRGGASSNITFDGTGTGGVLYMDQSSTVNSSLNNLSTNRTLTLGSDLTIGGTLTLNAGTYNFNVGANTLTLNGQSISTLGGTFTTTSSSNLVFGPAGSSVSIPSSVSTLNNLTINNSSGVTTLAPTTTVNGTLTLTSGPLIIGNNELTLKGASSAATGTISSSATGVVSYMQLSDGQSVLAGSYGSLTFSDFKKVLTGDILISGIFTPGNFTNHTVAGSRHIFVGTAAQTIPAFNYDNLIIAGSTGRAITLTGGTIGIASSFSTIAQNFTVPTGNTFNFYGAGNQAIPAGFFNYYNLSLATTGTKTISNNLTVTNNLTIGTGTTFSTSVNSYDVTVGGNWINNGTFTPGTNTVTFNGSGTQTISGTATCTFNNLTKGTASTLTLSRAVNLKKLLTITSGATFNSSGNLTLLSDSLGTAMIGNLTGVTFNGNIKVQRYIARGIRAYRFISSPTQSFNLNQLIDDIYITGPTASGFDENTNQTPSAHFLNTATNSWTSITSLTNIIPPGTGFRVFVRGNRFQPTSLYDLSVSPDTVTLDFIGAINKGAVTLPTSVAGTDRWSLVGNPYPCTIDWDAAGWTKTNIDNTVYVWKPAGNNTGAYATYINGVSTNGGSRYIPSGLGFVVHASSSVSSLLSVTEAIKVTNQDPTVGFRRLTDISLLRIQLKDNIGSSDEAIIRFNEDATPGFDKEFDAVKLNNPGIGEDSLGLNISSKSLNDYFVINTLPELIKSDSIPLNVSYNASGAHQLEFTGLESFSSETAVFLYDAFTKTSVDVLAEPNYTFTVNKGDVSSASDNRFKLYFSALADKSNLLPVATLFPNPSDGTFKLQIRNPKSEEISWKAYDLTGKLIAEKKYNSPADSLVEEISLTSNKGVYIISVQIGNHIINKKLVIQ